MRHVHLASGDMSEKLAPGIHVYNFQEMSDCYEVINTNIKDFFQYGKVVSSNKNPYMDLNSRKVKVYPMGKASSCHEDDPINVFKREIEKTTTVAIEDYRGIHSMDRLEKKHDWEILKYDSGDFFKTHMDDCAAHSRTVSAIVYFNEDYEGGEIEFPNFDVFYKPKSGDVLVFPSAFTYIHNVREITSGTRYAAVNWFSYAKRSI
jgi:Rps23 Pro-64 3,4-dihydroxylase Tpa1-like proline 4-hydroxylase